MHAAASDYPSVGGSALMVVGVMSLRGRETVGSVLEHSRHTFYTCADQIFNFLAFVRFFL